MKKIPGLTIVLFICFMSCKQTNKERIEPVFSDVNSEINAAPKTYAEISIKEGGTWEGREYIGGTFKNVNSVKVPKEHTDHSWYIRYEGPGWESNKVGYRLYLDWRNAIDIFGKVTDEMVLQNVGKSNSDSYHEMNDWGMDILKAGSSLGIGSYGRYTDGTVMHFKEVDSTYVKVANAPDHSSVTINYSGWKAGSEKIDLSVNLEIKPDSRITKSTLQPSSPVDGLCTGIVKFDGIPVVKKEGATKKWSYIATYGEQTLVPDKLGMAIFYNTESVVSVVESEFDHLVIFKPSATPMNYYFLAAWEKEKAGITNEKDFYTYLDEKLQLLEKGDQI